MQREQTGYRLVAALTQERKLQRQKESPLPCLLLPCMQVSWEPLEFRRKKAKSTYMPEGRKGMHMLQGRCTLGSLSTCHILPCVQERASFLSNCLISLLAFPELVLVCSPYPIYFLNFLEACAFLQSDPFPRLSQANVPLPPPLTVAILSLTAHAS